MTNKTELEERLEGLLIKLSHETDGRDGNRVMYFNLDEKEIKDFISQEKEKSYKEGFKDGVIKLDVAKFRAIETERERVERIIEGKKMVDDNWYKGNVRSQKILTYNEALDDILLEIKKK